MPIPPKEDLMENYGWAKELTIPKIVVREGVIYCQEWDFFAERLPCKVRIGGRGGRSGPYCGPEHTWVANYNGNLIWVCFKHKTGQGPLTFDVGHKAKEYTVSATQAIKILNRTGQPAPPELEGLALDERAKERIKRRPTKKA